MIPKKGEEGLIKDLTKKKKTKKKIHKQKEKMRTEKTIILGIKEVCNIIYYDSTVIAAKTLQVCYISQGPKRIIN